MTKFVAEIGEKWQNLAEYERKLAKYGEPPAKHGDIWRKCDFLTESGGKQQNLAKSCEIWRNVAKSGGMLAEFGENLSKYDLVGSGWSLTKHSIKRYLKPDPDSHTDKALGRRKPWAVNSLEKK